MTVFAKRFTFILVFNGDPYFKSKAVYISELYLGEFLNDTIFICFWESVFVDVYGWKNVQTGWCV